MYDILYKKQSVMVLTTILIIALVFFLSFPFIAGLFINVFPYLMFFSGAFCQLFTSVHNWYLLKFVFYGAPLN